jgi:hypothetical protein
MFVSSGGRARAFSHRASLADNQNLPTATRLTNKGLEKERGASGEGSSLPFALDGGIANKAPPEKICLPNEYNPYLGSQ